MAALIRNSHEIKAGDAALVHAGRRRRRAAAVSAPPRAVGAAKIIATASTTEKLELARKNGATLTSAGRFWVPFVNLTHGIDYSAEDWVHRVAEITGGEGVGKATLDGDPGAGQEGQSRVVRQRQRRRPAVQHRTADAQELEAPEAVAVHSPPHEGGVRRGGERVDTAGPVEGGCQDPQDLRAGGGTADA